MTLWAHVDSLLERLLPDEAFEGVMRDMVDSSWLRERAARIAASGEPGANEKAAGLLEAADELDAAPASAEGAP